MPWDGWFVSRHKPPEKPLAKRSQRHRVALFSFIVVALLFPFLVVATEEPRRTPRGVRRHHGRTSSFRRQTRKTARFLAFRPLPPARVRRASPTTGDAPGRPRVEPVPAFVVGPRRHHPCAANGAATALQQHRRTPVLRSREGGARSYLQDTPPLPNLKHLDDLTQAPGASPASTAVPRFATAFARPVTSVAAVTPQAVAVRPASRRQRRLRGPSRPRFPPTKTEARGTPRLQLFPVRLRLWTDSLARAFAPFVVELFAAGDFPRTPAPVKGPIPLCRQGGSSPRQQR
jgi:hypothetical protein